MYSTVHAYTTSRSIKLENYIIVTVSVKIQIEKKNHSSMIELTKKYVTMYFVLPFSLVHFFKQFLKTK